MLRSGGVLRFSHIDINLIGRLVSAEESSDQDAWDYICWYTDKFLPNASCYAGSLVGNHLFRNWGNEMIWETSLLIELLSEADFHDPMEVDLWESRHEGFTELENWSRFKERRHLYSVERRIVEMRAGK